MTRENKIVNIGGLEITMVPWITGEEYMKISSTLSNGQRVGGSGLVLTGDLYERGERLLFDTIIVSINGEVDKEKNWQTVKEIKASHFIEIDALVNKIYKGIDEEEEKK